jgi:glutathione peroxidase
MKALLSILFLSFTLMLNAQPDTLYNYSFVDIDGNETSLETFKGKKILFVNVASECGFTGQYDALQELQTQYGEELVIIGFPCDQFGGQEPGSEEEIKTFCKKNYGVTFLMASKIDVKGNDQHPIYTWLTSKEKNGADNSSVAWNFEKYIVDENGQLIGHFKSAVKPMSDKITSLLLIQ